MDVAKPVQSHQHGYKGRAHRCERAGVLTRHSTAEKGTPGARRVPAERNLHRRPHGVPDTSPPGACGPRRLRKPLMDSPRARHAGVDMDGGRMPLRGRVHSYNRAAAGRLPHPQVGLPRADVPRRPLQRCGPSTRMHVSSTEASRWQ